MRAYELCLIVHADTADDALQSLVSGIESVITRNKGSVLNVEQWGKKNFKYAIKKQTKGLYCFISFTGDNTTLKEIDRSIRYAEQILRYDTMLLPKAVAASKQPAAPGAGSDQPEGDQSAGSVNEPAGAEAPAEL